jgi:two-component system response regulator HydG
VVLSTAEYIDWNDLPFGSEDKGEDQPLPLTSAIIAGDVPLEEVEKATILNTLESAGGNKSEAARRLGITRKTLHKKLKKYGVMD